MARWIFLVGMLLALVGCQANADRTQYTWYGSADGYQRAVQAVAEWNETCGLSLKIDTDGDGDGVTIREVDELHEVVPDDVVGTTSDYGSHVEVEVLRGVGAGAIAHEIGHVLGLSHASQGIMRARLSGDEHVTAFDCKRL